MINVGIVLSYRRRALLIAKKAGILIFDPHHCNFGSIIVPHALIHTHMEGIDLARAQECHPVQTYH
jgi:hypothetical protein